MLGTRDAVPEQLEAVAQPAGVPGGVRIWGDQPLTAEQALGQVDRDRIKAKVAERARQSGGAATSNLLALSGGGDDGAFGAGLLVG